MTGDRVVMLPGLQMTARVFIERLLEHASKIEHIACVIQWRETADGKPTEETGVYSTTMPLGDAAWLRYVFDKDFPDGLGGADGPRSPSAAA
jgi:hypothetical protein